MKTEIEDLRKEIKRRFIDRKRNNLLETKKIRISSRL